MHCHFAKGGSSSGSKLIQADLLPEKFAIQFWDLSLYPKYRNPLLAFISSKTTEQDQELYSFIEETILIANVIWSRKISRTVKQKTAEHFYQLPVPIIGDHMLPTKNASDLIPFFKVVFVFINFISAEMDLTPV